MYTEALAVFVEALASEASVVSENEMLNPMISKAIVNLGALMSSAPSSQAQNEEKNEKNEDKAEKKIINLVKDITSDIGNDNIVIYHDENRNDKRDIHHDNNEHCDNNGEAYENNTDNVYSFPKQKEETNRITFKDVGGLAELKNTIEMKIIKPFQQPEIFAKFKKKSGGGIMLYGPPGCGKTFISKATAGECGAFFSSVGLTDVLSAFIGQSESNLSSIFSNARKRKPCVLFFDELDTLGFNRSKSFGSSRSIVNQLLVEMEGIDTNTDKLLIIGATNMPWDVDEALRRPGRFDRSVFVPPPDMLAREKIFRLKLDGRPIAEDIDYNILAAKSEFFSGADIENVVELAAEKVLEEVIRTGNQNLRITMTILIEMVSNAKPSTLGWLKTIATYVKYANQTGYFNDVEDYLQSHKPNL